MPVVTQLIAKFSAEGGEGVKKTLTDIHGEVGKAPSLFGKATAGVAGFVAGGAALDLIKSGIGLVTDTIGGLVDKAEESEAVMAETNAVLAATHHAAGLSTGAIANLATSLSNLTGIDDETVQSAENMLLTFRHIGSKGGIFDQASSLALDMAEKFHTGPEQAALQLGKALDDPATGYTRLQRIGVTFSQHQVDLIKKFTETGQVAKAQQVILSELGNEMGGVAAAHAHTLQGAMQLLNTQWDNFQEAIGTALIPALTDLLGHLTPIIAQLMTQLQPTLDNLTNALGPLVANFGAWIDQITSNQAIMGTLQSALSEIGNVLGGLLPIIQQVAPALLVFYGPMFGLIALIGTLIGWVRQLWTSWAPLHEVVGSAGAAIADFASQVQAKAMPALEGLQRFMAIVLPILAGIWNAVWPTLSQVLAGVWDVILGIVKIAWSLLSGIINIGLSILAGDWGGAWHALQDMLAGVWDGILTLLGGVGQILLGLLSGLWSAILAGGGAFIGGILGLLHAGFDKVVEVVTAPLRQVGQLFVELYNHNTFVKQLVDTIIEKFNQARTFVVAIWTYVESWLRTHLAMLEVIGRAALQKFVATVQGAISQAQSSAQKIVDVITAPIRNLGGLLHDAGVHAIQMLIDGIRSMAGNVGKVAGDIAGQIAKNLGFHSPTEEGPGQDADKWMPALGDMLIETLLSKAPALSSAAAALAAAIAGPLQTGQTLRLTPQLSASSALAASGGAPAPSSGSPTFGPGQGYPGSGGQGGQQALLILDGRVIGRVWLPYILEAMQQAGIHIQ